MREEYLLRKVERHIIIDYSSLKSKSSDYE